MNNITILGAGMVGRAMAIDLAKKHSVTSVDVSKKNLVLLPSNIKKTEADLSRKDEIENVIANADLVIGAVPGFMGFETVKTVINAGKNIVDISFFPEDCFELDALAKEKNVIAIMDCGVAPGMFNIILGYHNERMTIENFVAMCGGLPVKRTMPFQYKAPFSPVDVLEIYTRPAKIVVNSKVMTVPALSDIEEINFDEVGTLEAFNTDGLRSLLHTMKIPNMKEKTLRYPGHTKLMEQLREMGMFSEEEITVRGQKIKPAEFTGALFFPKWKYEPGEEEFTVMRITIEGNENGTSKKYTYNLFDRYDQPTKTSSMERTTGYTCTAAANLVLDGLYAQKGISPPEYLGKEEKCFEYVMNYLKTRNVNYRLQST
ncbi:MAG: saccharopine dehydrogenase NADP-binding domain-containing protein [Chitinophagales bacterium]|nr:saccharopine dehydrogenase NADP-binding domain-containing protein [Chitinophagales bacterium]